VYQLTKAHAALAEIAESPVKGYGRPVLQAIHLRPGHATAADGYGLLDVAIPNGNADAPPVLIPAPALKAALSTLKATKAHTEAGWLAPTDDGATLTTPAATYALAVTDGTYPDAERLFADTQAAPAEATVLLDAKRLHTLLGAMLKAGVGETDANRVRVELRGPNRAAYLEGQDGAGGLIRALLMPVVPNANDRKPAPVAVAPEPEPDPVIAWARAALEAISEPLDHPAPISGADHDDGPPPVPERWSWERDEAPAESAPEPEESADEPERCEFCGADLDPARDDCPVCREIPTGEEEPPPVSGGAHPAYAVTVERSADKGRTWTVTHTHDHNDGDSFGPGQRTDHPDGTVTVLWREPGRVLARATYTPYGPVAPQDEPAPTDTPDPAPIAQAPAEGVQTASEYEETGAVYIDRCDDVAELREMADKQRTAMTTSKGRKPHERAIANIEHRIAWLERLKIAEERADFCRALVDGMPDHHDCDAYTTMPLARVFAGDLTAEQMVDNLTAYLDQLAAYVGEMTAARDEADAAMDRAERSFADALLFKDSERLADAYRELCGDFPPYAVPRFAA
jgi:hypothetical protein